MVLRRDMTEGTNGLTGSLINETAQIYPSFSESYLPIHSPTFAPSPPRIPIGTASIGTSSEW